MAATAVSDSGVADAPVLLFVDILGAKAVWSRDGCEGASLLFDRLANLVADEVRSRPERVESGAVESDCAALICPTPADAVSVGIGLYQRAFFKPSSARTERLWLRGVVVPLQGPADIRWLRQAKPLAEDLPQMSREAYSDDLLDAISMEKSGFKGMRLLLDRSLHTPTVRRAHRMQIDNGRRFYPFRRLDNSGYAERLEEHLDVLWMAIPEADEWRKRRARMSSRMRFSARNAEEVLQAAATQVVFDECDAILDSLNRPAPKRARKVTRSS